jgi:peptide chain release factor 3
MYLKLPVHKACWVKPDDAKVMSLKNLEDKTKYLAHDKYGQLFLADSDFTHSNDPKQIPNVKLFSHQSLIN